MSDQLEISTRPGSIPAFTIVQPRGAIKLANSAIFQQALAAAAGTSLILDLSEVPYVDSAALGVLVHAYVSCQKNQQKLALVGLTHRVGSVIKLSALEPLFQTYATVAEAEAALK
jgi:anti-anti-sigma factor